jgi:hypothetical protein
VPYHTCRTNADRHDITLLFFPSLTACELQLMDKFVFDCDESFCCCTTTAAQTVLSSEIGEIFFETLDQADMSANITAGCHATIPYPQHLGYSQHNFFS